MYFCKNISNAIWIVRSERYFWDLLLKSILYNIQYTWISYFYPKCHRKHFIEKSFPVSLFLNYSIAFLLLYFIQSNGMKNVFFTKYSKTQSCLISASFICNIVIQIGHDRNRESPFIVKSMSLLKLCHTSTGKGQAASTTALGGCPALE